MTSTKIITFLRGRGSVYFSVNYLISAWVRCVLVRDEDVYNNPLRFYPERFLGDDLNKPLAGHWGFGAGRRGFPNLYYSKFSMRGLCICDQKSLDRHG